MTTNEYFRHNCFALNTLQQAPAPEPYILKTLRAKYPEGGGGGGIPVRTLFRTSRLKRLLLLECGNLRESALQKPLLGVLSGQSERAAVGLGGAQPIVTLA